MHIRLHAYTQSAAIRGCGYPHQQTPHSSRTLSQTHSLTHTHINAHTLTTHTASTHAAHHIHTHTGGNDALKRARKRCGRGAGFPAERSGYESRDSNTLARYSSSLHRLHDHSRCCCCSHGNAEGGGGGVGGGAAGYGAGRSHLQRLGASREDVQCSPPASQHAAPAPRCH